MDREWTGCSGDTVLGWEGVWSKWVAVDEVAALCHCQPNRWWCWFHCSSVLVTSPWTVIKNLTPIYAGVCWHGLVTSRKALHLFLRLFHFFALVPISADLYVLAETLLFQCRLVVFPGISWLFFLANNSGCVRKVRKVESLPALFLNKSDCHTFRRLTARLQRLFTCSGSCQDEIC